MRISYYYYHECLLFLKKHHCHNLFLKNTIASISHCWLMLTFEASFYHSHPLRCCCASSAQPGRALAAGPRAASPQTLLPDAGAAGRVHPESRVHRQGVRPPAGACRRPPSPRWADSRHPAVQRRRGPRGRESDVAGARRHLVAAVRVLAAGDQRLGPSPGLELGPPPGLAAQGHPQPAAAAVDAAVGFRSVPDTLVNANKIES